MQGLRLYRCWTQLKKQTMTSKKDLYTMLDELKYAELFEELDKLGLNTEAYQKLKKSFILGKTDIDFHDRLKALGLLMFG